MNKTVPFVAQKSIIREIWGGSDTILFIFAGAAAEFALNKSVDWLYFTGKLPNAPIERLLSTVDYARNIIFSDEHTSLKVIDKMTKIHKAVESKRGLCIPESGYKDVLYLLIFYSISAFELLERALTKKEKEEVFSVFLTVGQRMGIKNLPVNYQDWLISRDVNLKANLQRSKHTNHLYQQYRKHLGWFRNFILIETQKMLIPKLLKKPLGLNSAPFLRPCLFVYKILRKLGLHNNIKTLLLPAAYKTKICALDMPNTERKKGVCPFNHLTS